MEEKAIEEFLADAKNNNYGQISEEYKLFELVCNDEPKQVMRYSCHEVSEPLWVGDKNRVLEIPKCPCCGAERKFEL
jgi:hypothetical protein